jgi:hypothetical protein
MRQASSTAGCQPLRERAALQMLWAIQRVCATAAPPLRWPVKGILAPWQRLRSLTCHELMQRCVICVLIQGAPPCTIDTAMDS